MTAKRKITAKKTTNTKKSTRKVKKTTTFTALKLTSKEILKDFHLAWMSRAVSQLGRKEVLTGKAKFGIFGAGKELPQIALAKFYKNGDFRSGYYRDQTWMMAAGLVTVEQLFSQLYAHASEEHDPHSAGRQMNAHFATHSLDKNGHWNDLMAQKNTSADLSSTAAQMPRALGLALASQKYRNIKELAGETTFSNKGNEVTFASIGDASTSEGHFWETLNAAGVLNVPLAVSIWDDGYGISVPTKYQTTKGDIGEVLKGFEIDKKGNGFLMYTAKAWDYEGLIDMYATGVPKMRKSHNPAVFHVKEVTQPQGHSTSGSHERYKDDKRLQWEQDWDCLEQMQKWMVKKGIATNEELEEIKADAKQKTKEAQQKAWKAFSADIKSEIEELFDIYQQIRGEIDTPRLIIDSSKELMAEMNPVRKDIMANCKNALFKLRNHPDFPGKKRLINWKNYKEKTNQALYSSHLYSESNQNIFEVPYIEPKYNDKSPTVNGFQVLNACFKAAFAREKKLLAFGEDLGYIGDVNQGFAGLQEIYGEDRIFDTGIREATIMGQGIGLAMRGFRPIAEIQYLDYFIYGIQPLADDLATLQYRTKGRQKAPLIVRTRGHRLEGIWHAGSPISFILNGCRGIRLLVPRNMTQAAGFYNALLQSDEPAIVIECLNGYRLKEKLPENIGEFTTPFGVPEILQEGDDISIVTYGSCIRIVKEAMNKLQDAGISCELIDVQTLMPFDIHHKILESVKKTNRLLVVDEDVPGGATAFMLQKILEEQKAYQWFDSPPQTLTAKEHRTAYGSDGDYYTKPNAEDVFEAVYGIMHEAEPGQFPMFY